jgi:hypothetical protein
MTYGKFFKISGILALAFVVLTNCAGLLGVFVAPFSAVWYLATGWIYFLVRKLPQTEANPEAILTGLVALFLLGLAVHLLMHRFFDRAAEGEVAARSWRFRWTAAFIVTVVVLFTAGIATIGITHQTTWMLTSGEKIVESSGGIRVAADRINSANNLKQIGLAMHDRNDAEKSLPLATTFDNNGRALHGWHTYLLPYIEEADLYKRIDLSKPWNHDDNRHSFKTEIKCFRVPAVHPTDRDGYPVTIYAANFDAFGGVQPRRLTDFPQGTSNVIFAGEASTNLNAWGSPLNVRDLKLGLNQSPDGFGSSRKTSTLFLMGDGSVRGFSSSTDPEFLQYLTSQDRR